MRRTVVYKKGEIIQRKLKEATTFRGWDIVEEREEHRFNLLKFLIFGLLFPSLARDTYISVTYQKQ